MTFFYDKMQWIHRMFSFDASLSCLFRLAYRDLAKMPLHQNKNKISNILDQNLPIDVPPENVCVILHSVESDYEDELTGVIGDFNTEFFVEDDKNEVEKSLDSANNNKFHPIVSDRLSKLSLLTMLTIEIDDIRKSPKK